MKQQSDIEIARAANLLPIDEVGAKIDIPSSKLVPYGRNMAKLELEFIDMLSEREDGKLVLVTAITPSPAGEGKTTTTVGLGDALNRIGKRTAICLREPSLGPCFGMKGGAAGGGFAQVVPMEDINLHFTGDFHAIGSAHNLLAAMVDNHVHWGNRLELDVRRPTWRRVVDMNDRALRDVVLGLGDVGNGFPRQSGFDITVASEVMAIFCLANGLADLRRRLGNVIVGETRDRAFRVASDLEADGAMAVLLKDALMPNLVQTLENNPALVHGGPFANIAHGCNSVIATRTALKLADYVVTEAGFGADLGAEKFFDIKCRKAGIAPDAAVVVATIRALKMHGGVAAASLTEQNIDAVHCGLVNLGRHLDNLEKFGVPTVVAINAFTTDTPEEISAVQSYCSARGTTAVECTHWSQGSAGAELLARSVVDLIEQDRASFRFLYPDNMGLWEKIETIAQEVYGAKEATTSPAVRRQIEQFEDFGFGMYPVCMAKTQYSFSADPARRGAPTGHTLPVREVRIAAGAEFLVAICGSVMTMPGLPREPAATRIDLDASGQIEGLF